MHKTRKTKREASAKGVTLIALIVTIIVLLILAGITVSAIFGDNGIIGSARKAAEETEKGDANTQNGINSLIGQMDDAIDPPVDISNMKTVANKNTKVEDASKNRFILPKGFRIIESQGTHVTDGIVIQDKDENEFVWIPVGNIKDKENNIHTIRLGRYTFNSNGIASEPIIDNNAHIENSYDTNSYHQELETSDKGNATAISIENFKTSVANNGGYYMGRYEASYRSGSSTADYVPYCKKSTSITTADSINLIEGILWNNVSQRNAAAACVNMYKGNTACTSDLVHSYAWDTAIVFIQEFSEDRDYSRQDGNSINNSLTNTGYNDKVCNIYNMAGNTKEWTTETFAYSGSACTIRGGYYGYYGNYTSYRHYGSGANIGYHDISFRPILYIK